MKILIKYKGHMQNEGIMWNDVADCPVGWNIDGEMDYLYGKTVKVLGQYGNGYYIENKNGKFGHNKKWSINSMCVHRVIMEGEE